MAKSNFDITLLKEATGGDKAFFHQMLNTFIENAEITYHGLDKNLNTKNWKMIGEIAHKAIPSFKYFSLNAFVTRFKKLEDLTIRAPQYQKVPELVRELLEDMELLLTEARQLKFPE